MIWNVIGIIGILLIVNGIFMIQQGRVLTGIRAQMATAESIVCGTAKGLLFLTSMDIMFGVDRQGVIRQAFKIKSGYLRITKAESLAVEGQKIESLQVNELFSKSTEQKACAMAIKQYKNQKARKR